MHVNIPVEFWRSMSEEESLEVVRRGGMTKKQIRRLWAFLGRTDKPPPKMELMVNRVDMERLYSKPTSQ
jgi:hypothetical protein